MPQKKLTTYQKLTNMFGFPGQNLKPASPSFNFEKSELLKASSKEEFKYNLLQAQQSQYVNDKWAKLEQSLYNQSVYYEPNRLSSYYDYESMELTPEISAALDIFSEESCLCGNTEIPLLDGTIETIENLYLNNKKDFWVYGVDVSLDEIKPSKVEKVLYKGEKETFKIVLDDETEIFCTDDHKWLLTDNSWIETKNLKSGTSLKSIYSKTDKRGYEKVSLKNSFFKFTHTIVAENELKDQKDFLVKNNVNNEKIVTHHKSFNKKNNTPNELEFLYWSDHQLIHTNLNKKRWEDKEFSLKMRSIFSNTAKKTWSTQRQSLSEKFSISIKKYINSLSKEDRIKKYGRPKEQNGMFNVKRCGQSNPNYYSNKDHIENINEFEYVNYILQLRGNYIPKLQSHFNLTKESIILFNKYLGEKYDLQRIEDIKFKFNNAFSIMDIKEFMSGERFPKKTKSRYCVLHNVHKPDLDRYIKKQGYKSWEDICSSINNHRIKNIEYFGKQKVYDLYNSSVDSTFGVKCNNGMIISHNCTLSEKGDMLTIYSESERIKEILTDLFNERLNINTNLQMWARGTCKYGDDFVYLKIDPEDGIIGCQQLPNVEIERIEGASKVSPVERDVKTPPKELKFAWKNKGIEFQSWEIAHFRLLGDDRKLPYGTSMLDKIRRTWKQLLLAEDAMLIYRTSRAPERRVFKVFVGNMDDKDIEPYVQRVANKFKRDVVVDPRNGQVDTRYNQMAVDQDYFIPMRDMSQTSPIETLPGATNLSEIADIEYIQKKLLAALRIPKAFLGFEEAVGDGKSLALMDIRFARTINRIQKSLIQELNKIALIHLYLMGFEDELHNFTLSLTNPSAQSDLLRIEQWKEKITLYKDVTYDQSQIGILPVSHTWAKKNILGFSDSEILSDLEQQRMERAVGAELLGTPSIIKRTGIFDEIDKKYGIPEEERLKVDAMKSGDSGMGGMGGMGDIPDASGPLSESELKLKHRKRKMRTMFGGDDDRLKILNVSRTQENINEITKEIDKIINE
jgi:hypothetical protein